MLVKAKEEESESRGLEPTETTIEIVGAKLTLRIKLTVK
jgi:hypothetical protein